MSDTRREIRITIKEPQPGWWDTVKDLAVRQGHFVSHMVVTAIDEYVRRQTPPTPRPRVRYNVNTSNGHEHYEEP